MSSARNTADICLARNGTVVYTVLDSGFTVSKTYYAANILICRNYTSLYGEIFDLAFFTAPKSPTRAEVVSNASPLTV